MFVLWAVLEQIGYNFLHQLKQTYCIWCITLFLQGIFEWATNYMNHESWNILFLIRINLQIYRFGPCIFLSLFCTKISFKLSKFRKDILPLNRKKLIVVGNPFSSVSPGIFPYLSPHLCVIEQWQQTTHWN